MWKGDCSRAVTTCRECGHRGSTEEQCAGLDTSDSVLFTVSHIVAERLSARQLIVQCSHITSVYILVL